MGTLDLTIPERYRPWLRLGTCSWKYASWKGLIYDERVEYGPFDYLPEYAKHFNTVEVDQWFWSLFPGSVRMPDEKTVAQYAEGVPADFVFSVKVPNAVTLTHFYAKQPKNYAEFANKPNEHFLNPETFGRFLQTLAPMRPKLGPLIFQFEYLNRQKMHSVGEFLKRLDAFFDRIPADFQYAIETRNPNYLGAGFFDLLARRGLGFVFLDGYYMPPIGDVFGERDISRVPFTVIRLHGADREGMEERTGSVWDAVREPKAEGLAAAARILDYNVARSHQTLVNVNNHYEGSAPLTAERFLTLLRSDGDPDHLSSDEPRPGTGGST